MSRARLVGCAVAIAALAPGAVASPQTWHVGPGETFALGLWNASVYYDNSGGAFRLVAILADRPGSTPLRLSVDLKPSQGLTISIPSPAGKPPLTVRLMHTPDGLDITYPSAAID